MISFFEKNIEHILRGIVISIVSLGLVFLLFFHSSVTERLPEENFVNISIIRQVITTYSCEIVEDCPDTPSLGSSQASGMAFITQDDFTYILTADHFCQDFYQSFDNTWEESTLEIGSVIRINDINGDQWDGEIVYSESTLDLCLIRSNMRKVKPLRISYHEPAMGEKVFTISSPLGISGPGFALHFDGNFSGCGRGNICYYSLPATFGSSGSVVLNSDMQVVGVIHSAAPMIPNVSRGSGSVAVRKFLSDASRDLDVNLFSSYWMLY